MKRILIFGSDTQGEYLSEVVKFFDTLRHMQLDICVERRFADYLRAEHIDLDEMRIIDTLPENTDLIISMGGDGTYLRAAMLAGMSEVPVVGINTGHLGYLTGFTLADPQQISDAIDGKFHVSPRMLLYVDCEYIPEDFHPYGLNEISISKGDTTSMVSIRACVDGQFLADYQADGLIVATPTGSTAYNLSCGGPILQPTLRAITLTPIAPHSLTLRPLVVSADSELRLEVSSRGEECHVGVDGRTFAVPSDGTTLIVRRAGFVANVAQPTGADFSEVLRRKLRWAELPATR